ncbi:putative pyridoxal kinase [Tulasnella sp. 424]|nr:putative pyridoxal kinase [Tulasnella sp. 424]KAG8974758.1 putative pyridoxal kinase [Tulasnella sp. 425]
MSLPEPRRVLSIQSHVVSGYVGNRAATFPLEVLGWDVDPVNTVQYSNHAGYGRFGGPKTDAAQLKAIFKAMEDNGLMRPVRVLTGFIPGSEALKVVAELVKQLKTTRPSLPYILDPVMGDEGRIYVDADVVPIYRDMLLPLATVITPNWFEVELLTEIKLDSLPSLRSALRKLHREYGVRSVIISSIPPGTLEFPSSMGIRSHPNNELYTQDSLLCLASFDDGADDGQVISRVHAMRVPKIAGYFSGVGDLFSALVCAFFEDEPSTQKSNEDSTTSSDQTPISLATARAVNVTHAVLLDTERYYLSLPEAERPDTDTEKDKADSSRRPRRMRARELRIIQAIDVIRTGSTALLGDLAEWTDFWTS